MSALIKVKLTELKNKLGSKAVQSRSFHAEGKNEYFKKQVLNVFSMVDEVNMYDNADQLFAMAYDFNRQNRSFERVWSTRLPF